MELETHLMLSQRVGLLDQAKAAPLLTQTERVSRMLSGLRKALTRRPVADGAAEAAADAIEAELRAAGVTEVPSSRIGALAMEQLRGIDQIAYIRFASVYQSFEDLEDLKREVDSLFAERGDIVAIDMRGLDRKRPTA